MGKYNNRLKKEKLGLLYEKRILSDIKSLKVLWQVFRGKKVVTCKKRKTVEYIRNTEHQRN